MRDAEQDPGARDDSAQGGAGAGAAGASAGGAGSLGGAQAGGDTGVGGDGGISEVGAAGAAGADGGEVPLSACDRLAAECYRYDLGAGPAHDCEVLADGRNEEVCLSSLAECRGVCSQAAVLPFEIPFAARVGERVFDCGASYGEVGADSATIRPVDLRFYIHDVHLIDDRGVSVPATLTADSEWQTSDVALLDFEDGRGRCTVGTTGTNTVVRGTVPLGSYTGVSFKLGVPFESNHVSTAEEASPLSAPALFLDRNSGHQFLSLRNSVEIPGATAPFDGLVEIHSTGCAEGPSGVTSCKRPNRAEYRFDRFWGSASRVVADVEAVLSKSFVKSERCQSTEANACAWPFELVGIHWATGLPAPAFQAFLYVE